MKLNKVLLVGRICQTPELKKTQSGKSMVSFSLAVDRNGKDTSCDFVPCKAFDKPAELIATYMRKGSEMFIDGEFRTSKGNDGRSYHEVVVNNVQFGSKQSAGDGSAKTPTARKTTATLEEVIHDASGFEEDPTSTLLDPDLPF